MESYVVRIYRRNASEVPTSGVVELPCSQLLFPFGTSESLWRILELEDDATGVSKPPCRYGDNNEQDPAPQDPASQGGVMESLVIRVYRRNTAQSPISGLVELPDTQETFPFCTNAELWNILVVQGHSYHQRSLVRRCADRE